MPQLTPFYFVNEVTFAFVIIIITVYLLSKYILPKFVRLFLAKTYIGGDHESYLHNNTRKFTLSWLIGNPNQSPPRVTLFRP